MRLIQDTKVIENVEQIGELMQAVIERLPAVIANESQGNINRECRDAKKNTLVEIEDRLKMLTRFAGISIGNVPGEDLDQRLKARHNQAMAARNFLNAYDHYSADRPGAAPGSDFDPQLMRIIVMSVRAYERFEAARKDIIGNLIVPQAAATAEGKKA